MPGGPEVVRRRHRRFAGHAAANLSFVTDRKWPLAGTGDLQLSG